MMKKKPPPKQIVSYNTSNPSSVIDNTAIKAKHTSVVNKGDILMAASQKQTKIINNLLIIRNSKSRTLSLQPHDEIDGDLISSSSSSCSSSSSSVSSSAFYSVVEDNCNNNDHGLNDFFKAYQNHATLTSQTSSIRHQNDTEIQNDEETNNESSIENRVQSPSKNLTVLKQKKRRRRHLKWEEKLEMTRQLAQFRVRRAENTNDHLYFLNVKQLDQNHYHEDIISDGEENDDKYDELTNKYALVSQRQAAKRVMSFKTLLKKKGLVSAFTLRRTFTDNHNEDQDSFSIGKIKGGDGGLTKSSNRLCVKHNVYKKIAKQLTAQTHSDFASVCEQSRQKRQNKMEEEKEKKLKLKGSMSEQQNVASRHCNNKILINRANYYDYDDENNHEEQRDSDVVVVHSVGHGRVAPVLNQTFDEIYIQFLIDLQNREITPEDYEYLSRLDEQIKKKTASEALVNSLKTEQWMPSLSSSSSNGVTSTGTNCGVCMERLMEGDWVKHLPTCKHTFHRDCIDTWLMEHSMLCPLDNLPVAVVKSIEENQQDDQDSTKEENHECSEDVLKLNTELQEVMKSLLDQIELEHTTIQMSLL